MPEAEIFISYAHRDNKSRFEGEPGWVSAFHKALEVVLGEQLGREPSIWRDPALRGNDDFPVALAERLARVQALVCVVSPSYLKSKWCSKELHAFCEGPAWNPTTDEKSPIFKIVKIPVPPERHPAEVRNLLGYDFYVVRDEGDGFSTLESSDPEMRRDYLMKLGDLAQDLCTLLQEKPEEKPDDEPVEEGPAIFLADTTFDLKREHEAIKRDLTHQGYRVLPDRSLPLVAAELEAAVRAGLAASGLAVHLIGKNYGIVPEGSSESIVALQNRIAAECCAADDFQRLIWLPTAPNPEDHRQLEFVESLRGDNRNHVNTDLLETDASIEDLKTTIHQRLSGQEAAAVEAPDTDLMRVYVICEPGDQEAIQPLIDHLFDRGLEVITPVFEGSSEERRLDHLESLKTSDGVLIYYGEGSELWRRGKGREILKAAGYGRSRPLLGKALYVAPPATPHKESLRTLELTVLRPAGHPDLKVLDAFIAELHHGRASQTG